MLKFEHLFQPIHIGALEVPNRIVMLAMGTGFATEEGVPTDEMINYYAERAKGGTGLIIVEHTPCQTRGRWSERAPGIWDDKFIPAWRRLVDAIHLHGAKVALEIGHIGPSVTSQVLGEKPIAPSPIADRLMREVPHQMSKDEIKQYIEDYVRAVERAVRAGFDAVEIHCAHGYLTASFMSGRSNRRTDEYGGTLEGRLRLPTQLVRAVRQAVGPGYPLLARISTVEPEGGRSLEETKVLAKALVDEGGLDALDTAAGSYSDLEWEIPPYFFSPAFNVANIEAIKRSVNIPVIAAGRIVEPRLAEQILAEGRADLIGIGRGLLADPDWANKAASGDVDGIRRCIACLRCAGGEGWPIKCNVNPYVGKEGQIQISKAVKKKKVLVIGGGPAGLYATAISASRGHEVTLWEKESTLGGQVRIAAMPPSKWEVAGIISWAQREAEKNGGKLELNKEASLESILAFEPDVVVIASGASPLIPNIPGIDRPNVVLANDVLMGKVVVGDRVLIVGGGQVGCEVAHFLAEYGKDVTIVEMLDSIGQDVYPLVRPMLLRLLQEHRVNMMPSTTVLEFREDGVVIQRHEQKQILRGYDSVVLAVGVKSENALYEKVKGKVAEAYCIGDAREPKKILEALTDGLEIGLRI